MSTEVSAYAPGRVELLGNHTDYNEGVVLAAAIDRGLTIRGARRDDGVISLHSAVLDRCVEVPLTSLQPLVEERAWANYALGVVRELVALEVAVGGFSAQISGDLPAGTGLSSSAAFEVGTALFVLKLHGAELPPPEIAKLCQRAENHFVGVSSGLLDQITCVFGRADHAVFLDCRTEDIRTLPFPETLALIIADSGVKHQLVHGEYNQRREECRAAAASLGVRSLRDVTSAALAKNTAIDPLLRRRAAHIVGENERVWRAGELLASGDGPGFGALMNASHESSRTNFENSSPELDLLVEIARGLPGVLGSRLTGGGFGGGTVTLAVAAEAERIARDLARIYQDRSGHQPQVFACKIANGAA